jgi:hypothetical protein
VRALAASLAGGLAGLAAGAACVSWAPQVGRDGVRGAASRPSTATAVADSARVSPVQGVERVLAPAAQAGVAPARGRDDEGGSP